MASEIPAIITTAQLLLRGFLPAFVGCPIGDYDGGGGGLPAAASGVAGAAYVNVKGVRPSAFQMTYRKDLPKLGPTKGGYTGKLSWNLGKKHGAELCALSLPKEDTATNDGGGDEELFEVQVEEFWNRLEKALNEFIISNGNNPVCRVQEFASEEEALSALGMMIMDAGQESSRAKRLKKAEKDRKSGKKEEDVKAGAAVEEAKVAVGQIILDNNNGSGDDDDGATVFAQSLLHGSQLFSSLDQLGQIKILRENPQFESSIVCNKKKCEITIKFCVIPPEDNATATTAAATMATTTTAGGGLMVANLNKSMSKEIRIQEGLDYQLHMQQLALKNATLAENNAAPTTTAAENGGNAPANTKKDTEEMVVTAFEVSGDIDYNKLIEKFGSKPITPYLLRRLENVTVKQGTVDKLHRFLRREIFFSHRDMEKVCELLEGWYGISPPPQEDDGNSMEVPPAPKPTTPCPFYLYTGRGPSSQAMHLGHLVPFLFTAWLQKAFQCPLVIQMTDDEKFLFKGSYASENAGDGSSSTDDAADPNRTGDNLNHFAKLTIENAKDIIACDFLPDKTFLFSDLDYVGRMYPNIVRIWKAVTTNQVNGIFGFDGSSNIGKVAFPAVQAAPSFGSSFPNVLGGPNSNAATLGCLIPCAIDQDPYFRLTRDIAHKLVPRHHPMQGKPSLIHSKFFPPLQGAQGKMSSSDDSSAVFLTDTPEEIERKIKVHAFSGGRETKALQEELGADLDVDVSYQWLRFFLEDDEELARIGREYGSGTGEHWSTGRVKAKLVNVLKVLVGEHQERRKGVSEDVVKEWMTERCIV